MMTGVWLSTMNCSSFSEYEAIKRHVRKLSEKHEVSVSTIHRGWLKRKFGHSEEEVVQAPRSKKRKTGRPPTDANELAENLKQTPLRMHRTFRN